MSNMLIALVGLCVSVILDISLTYRLFWRVRVAVALVALALALASALLLLAIHPSVGSLLVALVGAYRIFHLSRILYKRSDPYSMRQAYRLSAWWLGLSQLLLFGLVLLAWYWVVGPKQYAVVLASLQLAVSVLLYMSLHRQLRTTKPQHYKSVSAAVAPTVTVAVPARNEDFQLEACLKTILANDYPKLEVLVLDDCSTDRTGDIIRGYAHDGVRFIKGAEPSAGWLAKNQAYDRLASEASGEFILFCGVDVRLGAHSIRELVASAESRHKDMVCVLPLNPRPSVMPVLQSMRYFWEMAPPRRLFRRPPVLSSCWLIKRSVLEKAGGFAAVSRAVTPEAFFARYTARTDGYSFVRSGPRLAVTSEKPLADQRETAILMRYPQLHRRVELVMLLGFAELALILGAPLLYMISMFWHGGWLTSLLSLLATALFAATYGRLMYHIFPNVSALDFYGGFPTAFFADVGLLHYSMYKYEFSQVVWKDRNVCYPVMHVEARLPDLPNGRR